jgi:hypothetical protein
VAVAEFVVAAQADQLLRDNNQDNREHLVLDLRAATRLHKLQATDHLIMVVVVEVVPAVLVL